MPCFTAEENNAQLRRGLLKVAVTMHQSSDLSSFSKEENLEKCRQGHMQGLGLHVPHRVLLLGGSEWMVGSGWVVKGRKRCGKQDRFCPRNPNDRVASGFAGSFQAERILSQTCQPLLSLGRRHFLLLCWEHVYEIQIILSAFWLASFTHMCTNRWMGYGSSWESEQEGRVVRFGGWGKTPVQFYHEGCMSGCLKEWKAF